MIIGLSANILTIEDPSSDLRPHQVSQVGFWGFAKATGANSYNLAPKGLDSVLPKLVKYFDAEGISYSLSPSCQEYLSKLSRLVDNYERIKALGEQYKEGTYDTGKFTEFSSFVSNNIARQLKDHQFKAAFHLYLLENGANFSVPGSGKTTVVLTVYEKLKLEGKVNLLFVVGPPACFGPWRAEFKLVLGREPDWRVLAGGEQAHRRSEYYSPASHKAELYLTTYQTLLHDQDSVITFFNQRGIATFLVIDEAHYIKQIGGNWARAVLRISEYAKRRCILTGTPMPRSYTDVFNLFDCLWPDSSPLDSTDKTRIRIHEEENDVESARKELQGAIGPLFYRVSKSDLGLIPAMFHPPHVVPMNRYERTIYHAIQNRIVNYAREDYLKNIDVVNRLRRGRIIRLRQCVSNVKLLLSAVENYQENLIDPDSDLMRIICDYDALEAPAKLEYLDQLVGSLQQERQKVVIWAHFVGTLELIVKRLTKSGFRCKLIYGATPTQQTSIDTEETRENIRNEFVDPESGLDVLVANPAACGESISLHKTCYHAIYYDLSYNCAHYLQSLDRIHRVGGSETNQANYHFLQYGNTIDQDIKDNLERKAQKMYAVIEADYGIYSLDMFEEEDDEIQAYERLFGRQ